MNQEQAKQLCIQTANNLFRELDRLGITYKATDRFGKVHSNVVVKRPKKYNYRSLNIKQRLAEANTGDRVVFDCGPFPLKPLHAAIKSQAIRLLGSEGFITSVDIKNQCVEVYVMALAKVKGLEEALAVLGAEKQ